LFQQGHLKFLNYSQEAGFKAMIPQVGSGERIPDSVFRNDLEDFGSVVAFAQSMNRQAHALRLRGLNVHVEI
jgi:hypothetical protein